MIDEYAQEAFESEAFAQLTRNSLEMVMRRDTLEAGELDVYNACVHWAEVECRRQHLEVHVYPLYEFFAVRQGECKQNY